MSEEDKTDIHNSGDYGVCISQEGQKSFYSAKDPDNAGDEFKITLELPYKDFNEQEDGKYIYEGDLKFYTYKTTLGVKELRDERTLEIKYPDDEKWVDLGLPSGILWAKYNVGASSPEEYGGYYAWGETEEKSTYTWENYKYGEKQYEGEGSWWTGTFIGSEISGTSYDVAHVQWGEGARMPTLAEIKELLNYCSFTVGTYNSVKGAIVTGPNGNSIFLPFAGYRDYDDLDGEGRFGYFWSGTYDEDNSDDAYRLYCDGGGDYDWGSYGRYGGRSVRPVTEK